MEKHGANVVTKKSSAVENLLSKTPLGPDAAERSWYDEVVDNETGEMDVSKII